MKTRHKLNPTKATLAGRQAQQSTHTASSSGSWRVLSPQPDQVDLVPWSGSGWICMGAKSERIKAKPLLAVTGHFTDCPLEGAITSCQIRSNKTLKNIIKRQYTHCKALIGVTGCTTPPRLPGATDVLLVFAFVQVLWKSPGKKLWWGCRVVSSCSQSTSSSSPSSEASDLAPSQNLKKATTRRTGDLLQSAYHLFWRFFL